MEYGNLLKVDAYGNVLVGVHGFHYMSPYVYFNIIQQQNGNLGAKLKTFIQTSFYTWPSRVYMC
jgi:hypothetical protein